MRVAVISDIHGNEEALEAVLDNISTQNVDEIWCLGDVVNYGADSDKCMDIVLKECTEYVEGNHEDAIFNEKFDRFSTGRGKECARDTVFQLSPKNFKIDLPSSRVVRVRKTPFEHSKCLLIHADLRDNWTDCLHEVNTNTIAFRQKYLGYDYVFFGHTHIPTMQHIFFNVSDEEMRDKKKVTFINPGSVGQPRDHNWKASYCIFDAETGDVEFIRVEYDIRYAQEKILNNPAIPDFYAERLEKGI